MNVANLVSFILLLAALLVCIVAWAGVAIKEPVLLALGLYFLALVIDRLAGAIVVQQPTNRG
jgi:hypothetical protein